MTNFIILDTNIYRQLGVNFFKHVDYLNLFNYCYASGSEVMLSKVVFHELTKYYTDEIISKPIKQIEDGWLKLQKIEAFKSIKILELSKAEKIAKEQFGNSMRSRTLPLKEGNVEIEEIIQFLLCNKQEIKKDNTRDYLLLHSAIILAKQNTTDQVILISNDNIFYENTYFKKLILSESIKNLKFKRSIPSFLNEYGFQVNYLTTDLIKKSIPIASIKKELKRDIQCLPSHISKFYYSSRKKLKVEKFEVIEIKVGEFYSFKEAPENELKFIVHFYVLVDVIFEPEKNQDKLKLHLESRPMDSYYLDTFDNEFRPVYKEYIQFIYEGILDEAHKDIKSIRFLDFMPDYYQMQKMQQLITGL